MAIRWAVDKGAHVINLSLVTVDTTRARRSRPSTPLSQAGGPGGRRRQPVRTAAGASRPTRPATRGSSPLPGIASRAATSAAPLSGDYVDVAAPGCWRSTVRRRVATATCTESAGRHELRHRVRRRGGRAGKRSLPPAVDRRRRSPTASIRTSDAPPEGRNADVGYGVVNPYRAVSELLGTRTDRVGCPAKPAPPRGGSAGPGSERSRSGPHWSAWWWRLALLLVRPDGPARPQPGLASRSATPDALSAPAQTAHRGPAGTSPCRPSQTYRASSQPVLRPTRDSSLCFSAQHAGRGSHRPPPQTSSSSSSQLERSATSSPPP